MGKNKKSHLKHAGEKRRKVDNLEVQLREDLADQAGVLRPAAPRAPKQRRRADSDEEDVPADARAVAFADEQRDEEEKREADEEMAARHAAMEADSDDESELGLSDDGDDVDERCFEEAVGAEALSARQMSLVDGLFGNAGERRTLADIILEKIAEKERGAAEESDDEDALPEKVVEAYSGMVPLLSRYRCGKLPKAFKVIPALERWEEVLWLTRPDLWSAQCVHAATKVFAATLDPARAKLYFGEVLLERCREDIRNNRRLNYHLYQALHRALFKPAPWFKGVLLPLVRGSDCTLREAVIFGSVLAKASVPAAHSAVVVLKLAELEYSGVQSLFLIVLLNKKHALPRRVVDAVAKTFLARSSDGEDVELPVLWHQSLLVFVQRYRVDLDDATSAGLLKLLKVHKHSTITHEIRRELVAGHRARHG
mmetsp:Transcript_11087/g.33081  ORF Transcript_11087/g.33081 Transcript_11087/m.33081 type:complete len:426 (+) Transcript_11087:126-1403(+)